jgi:peptidoglycan/xylan/chitin deacetylase (PgdA/CDA1 family)
MKTTLTDIACNGYNFEDFTTKTLAQQKTLMTNSKSAIQSTLGVTPTVFIPPYNSLNTNTKTAATATGFTHVSAIVANDPQPYNTSANPWRFPANAFTYDTSNEK